MNAVPPLVFAVRKNALRCLALLAVGATAAIATHRLAANAAALQRHEAERQTTLIASRKAVGGDAAQAEAGETRLRDLIARGIVGPEHRVDWLRQMSEIGDARRLPNIEFELAPQQPAVIEGVPQAGRFEFLASPMKLHIGLLHEQDLLGFLEELGNSISALLRIESCRIERAAEAGAPDGARLSADCRVDWITLRERP